MEKWDEIKKQTEAYSQNKVTTVLKELTRDLLKEKPEDVYEFIEEWAGQRKTPVHSNQLVSPLYRISCLSHPLKTKITLTKSPLLTNKMMYRADCGFGIMQSCLFLILFLIILNALILTLTAGRNTKGDLQRPSLE